jgi:predicted Zn-dependent protease with MMP-like domain
MRSCAATEWAKADVMTPHAPLPAPSLDDFTQIARTAWANLPGAFTRLAGDVVFRIEDFADEDVLSDMEIEDPFELTGLYSGVDLTRQSVSDPLPATPMVFLYRRPILDEWAERGDVSLRDLITHVLVHEVGHHFGLSDEAMDALLDGNE